MESSSDLLRECKDDCAATLFVSARLSLVEGGCHARGSVLIFARVCVLSVGLAIKRSVNHLIK